MSPAQKDEALTLLDTRTIRPVRLEPLVDLERERFEGFYGSNTRVQFSGDARAAFNLHFEFKRGTYQMPDLMKWLRSKSITSHSVAAALVLAATVITSDQQVRDFVLGLFQAHPKIATAIVSLAAIILKYSHSSSPAGAIAQAQTIEATPNAPTQAAVDAAKPK